MKKSIVLAAAGSLFLAGTAFAQDVVIDIPAFGPLSSGQSHIFQFTISDNPLPIIGFSFEGHWDTDGGTWASDTQLRITDPVGNFWAVGGYFGPIPANEDWDFQGGGSDPNGMYFHGPSGGIAGFTRGGTWTLEFHQDFGTLNLLSDGKFTIHKIPAPGALALLGVAGLAGIGRRRRN